MPNIPPHVAYFPKTKVSTADAIFATLQGEDSEGANITSLTASAGISATPSTGSVLLTNLGIKQIVGAGGIGAAYNAALDEVELSYPAVGNVAGVLKTFIPLAFNLGSNITEAIDQGTDVNLFTITMPVASTYMKVTLFFAKGNHSQDPILWAQGNVGTGTINPFIIYLSYINSTGTPPTDGVNNPIYLSPNSYVFNSIAKAVQDPDTLDFTGGTFMPNITLEMFAPDPTNIWYVNLAHLGPRDPNVRVIWSYQTIEPDISTARGENVVSEQVVTPD
jgi:hypothetical protein